MHHSVAFHCPVEKKRKKSPHNLNRKGKQLFKHAHMCMFSSVLLYVVFINVFLQKDVNLI